MATLLAGSGINPKVVAERLGHSNINTTLEVYTHVTPGMQREASELLEKVLYGETGTP
jgi:integrase